MAKKDDKKAGTKSTPTRQTATVFARDTAQSALRRRHKRTHEGELSFPAEHPGALPRIMPETYPNSYIPWYRPPPLPSPLFIFSKYHCSHLCNICHHFDVEMRRKRRRRRVSRRPVRIPKGSAHALEECSLTPTVQQSIRGRRGKTRTVSDEDIRQ